MNRTICFAKRNFTEMSRDILSYIFCVAFPLAMLVIMTLVNESIPKEAGMTIFRIDNLSGGVAVFGQTFVMLFTALSVSKDRSGSFLIRLFASPMKSSDFTNGYILPMLFISVIQACMIMIASLIISFITGFDLNLLGLLAGLCVLIPSAVFFTSIGLIFGTLFNQNAAPGLCSIIISLGSFIGGIWFDAEGTGGILLKIAKCLPFFYCTKLVRCAVSLDFGKDFLLSFAVVLSCAVFFALLSSVLFKTKMKADLQ
ncbi:MAG: ABC transporter permease [Lachnospiraceae bacterium]|nr:ABC transporter permease [Lachnospiraceae bacterium]